MNYQITKENTVDIMIDYTELNDEITNIIFVLYSPSNQSLSFIENVSIYAIDYISGKRIGEKIPMNAQGVNTCFILSYTQRVISGNNVNDRFSNFDDSSEEEFWVNEPIQEGMTDSYHESVVDFLRKQRSQLFPNMKTNETQTIRYDIINHLSKGGEHILDSTIKNVYIRVTWDVRINQVEADLACTVFDAKSRCISAIHNGEQSNKDETISHMGDYQRSGNYETICIKLEDIDDVVRTMVFSLVCFSVNDFQNMQNIEMRVICAGTQKEIAIYNITLPETFSENKAMIIGSIFRDSKNQWVISAIGAPTRCKVFADTIPAIRKIVVSYLKRYPPPWAPDVTNHYCTSCKRGFNIRRRRHHCRNCGEIFCGNCANQEIEVVKWGYDKQVRVCVPCYMDISRKKRRTIERNGL
eukprot:TRINITY_DN10824_c0_g1_i1.p1 TRINITY_DN10824_c0_g1~~TRINITY_DN10824_c0_g1_i1.p1  ORF type:complete len:482 (+),score=89.07 TRINITY_DN10824_c0_g1_i1:212-1447(+)